MADLADVATEAMERYLERAIRRHARHEIQPGTPGECDFCGEWTGRLIGGACAPCRDKYRLDERAGTGGDE